MPWYIQGPAPIDPRKLQLQRDWNAPRQADLAAMGVARQQQIEPSVGGLAINLRSMRKQDRKRIGRDVGGCLLDIVDPEEMGVVYSSEIDLLVAAGDHFEFVQKHANAHVL